MEVMDIRFSYTEQEAKDAQAAVLDCMKGKLQMRARDSALLCGGCLLVIVLMFSKYIIACFSGGCAQVEYDGIGRSIILSITLLLYAAMHFCNMMDIRYKRRHGITDEVVIENWYNVCKEKVDVMILVFGKSGMQLMPHIKPMAVNRSYRASHGAFEYGSGIVVVPEAWEEKTYFIPRRVLDEHNGEIEKFLEKKLRKRYKVMGR